MLAARTWFALPVALSAAILAACAGGNPAGTTFLAPSVDAGKPQVVIQSPPGNAQVLVGQPVEIVTTAVDAIGIGRIDVRVNGSTISSAEAPPGGLTSFSAVHLWVPAAPGVVDLSAVAYRTDGAPGEPMTIAVYVLVGSSTAEPYETFAGPLPTYRASAVPTNYVKPTHVATPTYVATPTATASPTYTTTPTMPIAPPDGTYNWNIPLGDGSEFSDYVSFPTGDIDDSVDWHITGMSPFPPENIAKVNVFATCEGIGTQYVTFLIGLETYKCGDQIINRNVTSDAPLGRIKIHASGPAYVHYFLNGNAVVATTP